MVQHPIFGEVSKNFNEDVALAALEVFKSDPLYYHTLLQMHAHDVVSEVKFTNPEVFDELITKKYEARKEILKNAVMTGVISKSMSSTTADEIVAAMDQIQKDISGYTEWERSANTKQQRRDPRGRFVPMGKTKIDQPFSETSKDYDWERIAESYDRITRTKYRDALPPGAKNVPTIKNGVRSKEMNAKHSAAYLQVADALHKIDPGELVMADVKWEQRDENGARLDSGKTTFVGSNPSDFIRQDDYKKGRYVTSIDWYMDMDSANGGGYDLLTGAGMAGGDYLALSGMARNAATGQGGTFNDKGEWVKGNRTGALYNYNTALANNPNGEYGTGAGYNRLAATAQMIDTIGGDALSGEAKWALGAAKYVGEHGPEAEKVLGPTARRTAYRYRGVERKPDPKLDRAIAASIKGATSIEDARTRLIHPTTSTNMAGNVASGDPSQIRMEQDLEFSPFIKYWQSQLPKKENLNLHLNSGAIAPSQGIVFDAKGQVVSQAVGYGDDHYLPFNLRNLSRANRGEWVRTRTMGGPTTEDIYAALTTGTRSVTVVSHSGVYNIEFDESFRGGRRYNDKAARMVRRYSQLLDTLEAENTTLGDIPSDRKAEFNERAAQLYRGDTESAVRARQQYVGELIRAERADPKPSQERIDQWTEEFGNDLAEKYAERYSSNRNFPDVVSWDQVKASQSVRAGRLLSDVETIEALGLSKQYNRYIEFKKGEYRSQQVPLKLNGQGYYYALQALQEQFPYYIKRVEWYPPNEMQSGTDKGYVKQNFLRSADILEGFWDPEIEGYKGMETTINGNKKTTGKVRANRTNYQNFENRQALKSDVDNNKGFLSNPPLKMTYGGDAATPSSAPPSGGAGVTNPQSTTTSAAGGSAYGSSLVAGIAGTGIRMTREAEERHTPESVAGMVALADELQVLPTTTPRGQVPFGTSDNPAMPRLTKWQASREQIMFGDEEYINNLGEDFTMLFDRMRDDPGAKDFQSKYAEKYRTQIKNKKMRAPKSAVEAVSAENRDQQWSLGPDFIPNREPDVYYRAQRDSDIRNFRDRAPLFKSEEIFRNSVIAADAAMRNFPQTGFIYGNQTYYKDDREALAKTVENDVYGYLKTKALNRFEPTIPGPFDEAVATPDTTEEAEALLGQSKEWKSPRRKDEEKRAAKVKRFDTEVDAREAFVAPDVLPDLNIGSNGSKKSSDWNDSDKDFLEKNGIRLVPVRPGNG